MTKKHEHGDKARTLNVPYKPDKPHDELMAEFAMSPLAMNAATAVQYTKATLPDLSLESCIKAIKRKVQDVNAGDLSGPEETLTAQAATLDAIFNNLAKRAVHAEYMSQLEPYLRLALKAQAQCTRTLEVLAAIKNPPVVIARQANIAQQQQVNNNGQAVSDPESSRARNTASPPNKLLEPIPDERLDFGTQGAASGADSPLATVGTVHRPQN